jgi:hypothetical protein
MRSYKIPPFLPSENLAMKIANTVALIVSTFAVLASRVLGNTPTSAPGPVCTITVSND